MGNAKTVTLELLRDGPSHNQLLSPLTVYLAACQNRPPEPLRLAIEHRDFLRWQGGLTYAGIGGSQRSKSVGDRDQADAGRGRLDAIADASQAVTGVLGSIRALIAELASEPCDWRHVHLVLDAAELGALPFELAHAAPGLMVEGERLFLQQNARVTLTRQTRRIATSVVHWPRRPRILCIVADGDLPLDAHVLALRQAVDPWVGWFDGDRARTSSAAASDDESDVEEHDEATRLRRNRQREAQQMLTVLVDPSLEEISRATRETQYTHVHVLAHGAPLREAGPGQTLYGLCFRGTRGGIDVVDGDRLESALRTDHACRYPTVVTVATCEGASVSGGILGPGGSVAHALHAKGVPLVVSAQFPLSMGASAIFAEMLYASMLRGDDPREAVHAIRRELLVTYPDTHDWASLVVYASFPSDLEKQLAEVRMTAERLAVETAVERLSVSFKRWRRRDAEQPGTLDSPSLTAEGDADASFALAESKRRLEMDAVRLDEAVKAIRRWLAPSNPLERRITGYRLLASIAMRVFDMLVVSPSELMKGPIAVLLQRTYRHDDATGERALSMLDHVELLGLAQDCYLQVYALDGMQIEAWVQVAFLQWLITGAAPDAARVLPESLDNQAKPLQVMHAMSEQRANLSHALGLGDRDELAQSRGVAFETALLLRLMNWNGRGNGDETVEVAFKTFVSALSPVSSSYRAFVMWRKLRRYEAWGKLSSALDHQEVAEVARGYRRRLQGMGVRRYWGPRY